MKAGEVHAFFIWLFKQFPFHVMHVCVSVCTCSLDKNTMSYQREIKGGKSLKNLPFPTHFQARPMSKNNHHHCFSALITEFM